jgi:hypothetical protein
MSIFSKTVSNRSCKSTMESSQPEHPESHSKETVTLAIDVFS